ncbi:MAG TPA: RNA methyltransferase [Patescibacteria group bacterium]|nr:RNA methyltransferase [Patescibacteria group bacterium]
MTGEPITSLTNPRVKAAVRLRDRREREETGLTIVDGAREILRALDAGVRVQTAFIAPDLLRSEDALSVDARIHDWPAAIEVSPAVLAKVAYGDRSDGIVAIVEAPARTLGDIALPADPLILVIDGVEKPGNLGAILRTADAAGAHAVIASEPRTDLFNPNAIRASIGTIFSVPIAAAPTADVLAWLATHQIRAVAAVVGADRHYATVDLAGSLAIVLGSEADGLSAAWLGADTTPIAIPMHGIADSLNVSIAAAVVLFEAVRQRSVPPNRGH